MSAWTERNATHRRSIGRWRLAVFPIGARRLASMVHRGSVESHSKVNCRSLRAAKAWAERMVRR